MFTPLNSHILPTLVGKNPDTSGNSNTFINQVKPSLSELVILIKESWNSIARSGNARFWVYLAILENIVFIGYLYYLVFQATKDTSNIFLAILGIILLLIVWFLISKFTRTFFMAALSVEIAKSRATEFPDLQNAAIAGGVGKLILITLATFVLPVGTYQSRTAHGGGIQQILSQLFFSMLSELLDFAFNCLIPAIVIERSSWSDIIERIKKVKNHVAGAMAGTFGFETMGVFFGWFVLFVAVCIAGVSMALLYGFLSLSPVNLDTITLNTVALGMVQIPILILITWVGIVHCILSIVGSFWIAMKTSFFTSLYISMTRGRNTQENELALEKKDSGWL